MHELRVVSKRRVMIVEDGKRFREMLTCAIDEMEFHPRPVESAEKAIESLEAETVEIAIVDLGLPAMSGLELCQYLRQHNPSIQIIILTGYGDLDAAKQAIRLDVVDFLTKPCDHNELEIALDRALRRSQPTPKLPKLTDQEPAKQDPVSINPNGAHEMTIEELERRHILIALERYNGNRAIAAQELGISIRTLYYRLNRYKALNTFKRDHED